MKISDMVRKEFDTLPTRGWNEDIGTFSSLVILPGRAKDIHDSGYRDMDFVAIDSNDEPIARLSGGSDVVHINGIGGLGQGWLKKYGKMPDQITPVDWSIDCLPKSGLLRLFCSHKISCGLALSSFEVYAENK